MNIEAHITELFHKYDALARQKYPSYAARRVPTLKFFTKGRASGWAKYDIWTIEFNTHVAAQAPEEFANTVSHEIAHMVDYAMRGRSGHDRIWKAIHRSLGGNGSRCSQYSAKIIPGRNTNQYRYVNANGAECWVGPRHHGKLQRGEAGGVRDSRGNCYSYAHWTGQSRKKHPTD